MGGNVGTQINYDNVFDNNVISAIGGFNRVPRTSSYNIANTSNSFNQMDWGGAIGSIFGAIGAVGQVKANGKALLQNVSNMNEAMLIQQRRIAKNREQLNRELGMVLSENSMQVVGQMANAKVMGATTGTIGGTTEQTVNAKRMIGTLMDADAIMKARNQENQMLHESLVARIQNKWNIDSALSGQPSGFSSFMQGINATLSGYQMGQKIVSGFLANNPDLITNKATPRQISYQGGLYSQGGLNG